MSATEFDPESETRERERAEAHEEAPASKRYVVGWTYVTRGYVEVEAHSPAEARHEVVHGNLDLGSSQEFHSGAWRAGRVYLAAVTLRA